MLELVGWPPQCLVRAATGVPCPLCGMTTGVLATLDGRLADAVAANPAAPVLVLAVVIALVVRFAGRGRVAAAWRDAGVRLLPLRMPVLAGMWLFELRRFGTI